MDLTLTVPGRRLRTAPNAPPLMVTYRDAGSAASDPPGSFKDHTLVFRLIPQ